MVEMWHMEEDSFHLSFYVLIFFLFSDAMLSISSFVVDYTSNFVNSPVLKLADDIAS
jgi:hypothetical protein